MSRIYLFTCVSRCPRRIHPLNKSIPQFYALRCFPFMAFAYDRMSISAPFYHFSFPKTKRHVNTRASNLLGHLLEYSILMHIILTRILPTERDRERERREFIAAPERRWYVLWLMNNKSDNRYPVRSCESVCAIRIECSVRVASTSHFHVLHYFFHPFRSPINKIEFK